MITRLHEESGNESCQVLLRRIKSIMDDIDKIYLGTKDIQKAKKYDEVEEKKNVAKTRKDLEKAIDLLSDVQDIIDDVCMYVEEWTEENSFKKESKRPSRKHLRNRLSEAESMMQVYKEDIERNKLLEKSNFDDTEKAINYYYPKWYYDDMSINDIYDRLEKLGHSQDFIDAVIDGITSRYENEEDYGLDDYDECLTEDSLDDIVRPEIKKRYIWPLYEDSAYEVVEIIKKYQNTNRFKDAIKRFDLKDISYMDWPALQLEIECSYEAYVLIRKDIEREGLFMDDDDMEESIQESKVGDVEDSKLPKRAKDYLKSMGWDSANIDGDVYYTMHFSENEDCDLYIDEFGNCYLVVGEYDVKPTDMFYTIVDDYKTDIDDLMKLGDMVASGNDVDKVMELFFG